MCCVVGKARRLCLGDRAFLYGLRRVRGWTIIGITDMREAAVTLVVLLPLAFFLSFMAYDEEHEIITWNAAARVDGVERRIQVVCRQDRQWRFGLAGTALACATGLGAAAKTATRVELQCATGWQQVLPSDTIAIGTNGELAVLPAVVVEQVVEVTTPSALARPLPNGRGVGRWIRTDELGANVAVLLCVAWMCFAAWLGNHAQFALALYALAGAASVALLVAGLAGCVERWLVRGRTTPSAALRLRSGNGGHHSFYKEGNFWRRLFDCGVWCEVADQSMGAALAAASMGVFFGLWVVAVRCGVLVWANV